MVCVILLCILTDKSLYNRGRKLLSDENIVSLTFLFLVLLGFVQCFRELLVLVLFCFCLFVCLTY